MLRWGHGDARQNIWILPASLPCLFLTTTLYGAAALLAVSARSVHLNKLVTKPCFGPAFRESRELLPSTLLWARVRQFGGKVWSFSGSPCAG